MPGWRLPLTGRTPRLRAVSRSGARPWPGLAALARRGPNTLESLQETRSPSASRFAPQRVLATPPTSFAPALSGPNRSGRGGLGMALRSRLPRRSPPGVTGRRSEEDWGCAGALLSHLSPRSRQCSPAPAETLPLDYCVPLSPPRCTVAERAETIGGARWPLLLPRELGKGAVPRWK